MASEDQMTIHSNLESIAERIRGAFDSKNAMRDRALARSRELIRFCALSIRAVHREDYGEAQELLRTARASAVQMKSELVAYPDLYHAGYTQDALKEYAEAATTYAMVRGEPLPEPEELGLEYATYLNGLAEAAGELRRHAVDRMRLGQMDEAGRLLEMMDEIYDILVTMDYPDAITAGLRRITDMVRGVTERTRGDLMLASRQQELEAALGRFEGRAGLSDERTVEARP
jgi:translin